MNIIKSTGESSCKGRENGDDSTGSDRPLKKARFAWQVKGKYHLKNDTGGSNINLSKSSEEPSSICEPTSSQSSPTKFEREVENYLAEQDYSKLDYAINPANSLLPNSSISSNHQQYPRYLSSYEKKSSMLENNRSIKTVSLVVNAEDQCIAQWQAGQVAKGCLDNTLNKILESWTADPFPTDDANPNRFLALNFAEFINHLPGDNSVENEGILMAISAHGLQNTSSSNSNNASNKDCCSASISSNLQDYEVSSGLKIMSPVTSDDDSQCKPSEKLPDIDWQCDNQNANDATPFAFYSESSQSPYDFCDDSHQNSNTDSLEIDSHLDFMNAAVLFAIKSKGLTVSGIEYS